MSYSNPYLHTPEAAATLLSIGRTRVYQLMATGELVSVTVGRSRRISDDSIRAYIASLSNPQVSA